jgi:hypothetical protein
MENSNDSISSDAWISNGKSQDFRYERKFRPGELDEAEMRLLVMLHPKGFKKTYPDRQINNIYFDRPSMAAFHENIEGVSPRMKLRIRWYGDLLQYNARPFLEIKRKFGFVGDKIRIYLPDWDNHLGLSDFDVKKLLKDSVDPAGYCSYACGMNSILVNRYVRSYFETCDRNFRLTVDRNLSFCAFSSGKGNLKRKVSDPDTIVELKYAAGHDREADLITKEFAMRVHRISKYVQGVLFLKNNFLLDWKP